MTYNKGLWGETRKGVGAFYFDTPVTVKAPLNDIFINVLQPTVYAFKNVDLDFSAIPVVGTSPFTATFTVKLNLLNSSLKLRNYEWYFDFDRSPSIYTTSTNNQISQIFNGYIGKAYSIKLIVRFEDNSFYELYKQNYITLLGQALPIRFGTDVKINYSKFLSEGLR